MDSYRCSSCNTFFSAKSDAKIARCPRCGTLCKEKLNDSIAYKIDKMIEIEEEGRQNFKCVECGNEFEIIITDKKSANVCTRCRGVKLKPISPIAFISKNPRKNKLAAKFVKYIETWEKSHKGIEESFNNIVFLCKSLSLSESLCKEVELLRDKILSTSSEEKDRKLNIKQ